MILLQLSAGQGPIECCKAVGLALQTIEKQCRSQQITLDIIEAIAQPEHGCFKSVLLQIDITNSDLAKQLAQSWQGAMLWVCQSQYRAKHKRKNWFFSGQMYEVSDSQLATGVTFQTCRASGAGGQHVNTTESAVRITHIPTNVVTQCQNQRSQHKNKDQAMKQLKAKLYEHEMKIRNAESQALEDSKADIGWGSQIRSYVLDDSRIKDLRTGVENRNTGAVLDGALDPFIEASLKKGL